MEDTEGKEYNNILIKIYNKMLHRIMMIWRVNLCNKVNQTYQSNRIRRVWIIRMVLKVLKVKVIIHKKNKNFFPQVENASINYVPPRKYTKKSDQEQNKINIVFSAKIAMKIITIIFIANFVNKFTQILVKMKTMTNGLAVIIAKDG